VSKLENSRKEVVECGENSSTGTGSGLKKIVKASVLFKKCTSGIGKCHNVGTEEIKTTELEGEIGYIEPKANKEDGEDLWPASRTAAEKEKHEFTNKALFAEFTCGIVAGNKVWGSVIGKLTPVNTLVKTTEAFTLAYEAGTNAGEQKIKKLEGVEGGVEDVLTSSLFGFEAKSNEQTTQSVKFEEDVEVKA
jgi:hypothetical protein